MSEPTRQQLETWDRHHYWHAFTQMADYEPLIFEHAYGCTLVDVDGREYLDGVSSVWCNVHGHRHPRIDSAIQHQLQQVAHTTSLGASSPVTIQLARRLAELAPGDLEHVFFSSDGASAVEVALKMAFQFWRQCSKPKPVKTKYIALGQAYHGDTLGSMSVGGVERFHAVFAPLLFDVLRVPVPDPRHLAADIKRDEAAKPFLEHIERLLERRHHETAAIVIEPLVQCAAGMIMHPPGFLQGVRDLASRYDVFLIADEVATGFGRTGTMFACEQEQVVPDFLCLGKGITGGYLPLAATITTPRVWRAFLGDHAEQRTFCHGHTYGGNPLAAAAALACIDIFEEEQTLKNLAPKVVRLGSHLSRLTKHPHVADTRQTGLIAAIDLAQHKDGPTPFDRQDRIGWRVCQEALDRGVWLRPLGDTIVIMPPLAIKVEQLDRIMEALARSIDVVTA